MDKIRKHIFCLKYFLADKCNKYSEQFRVASGPIRGMEIGYRPIRIIGSVLDLIVDDRVLGGRNQNLVVRMRGWLDMDKVHIFKVLFSGQIRIHGLKHLCMPACV